MVSAIGLDRARLRTGHARGLWKVFRDKLPTRDGRYAKTFALIVGSMLSALAGFGVALAMVSVVGPLLTRGQDDTPLSRSLVFGGYLIWGAITLAGAFASWRRFWRKP